MSAINHFCLIETSQLDELIHHADPVIKKVLFRKKVTDHYWSWLSANSTTLPHLDASGYLFMNLFIYLEDIKKLALLKSRYERQAEVLLEKRGTAHFLFTIEHKNEFSELLDPSRYSAAEFIEYNKDFSVVADEETGHLMMEALSLFKNNLDRIQSPQHVLLLVAG